MTAIEDGGGAGRRPSAQAEPRFARAIGALLTLGTSGPARSLADTPPRRSGHVTGPDGTDSQADSAGSIPVTRSVTRSESKPQVSATVPARW